MKKFIIILLSLFIFSCGKKEKCVDVNGLSWEWKFNDADKRAVSNRNEVVKKINEIDSLNNYIKGLEIDYKIAEESSNNYKDKIDKIKSVFKGKPTDYEMSQAKKKSKQKDYFKETPYKTFEEFIVYWCKDDGIKPFVKKHNIPARTILTRWWKETRGGTSGSAGKQGATFAIKAKKGDKIIYAPDDDFVNGKKVKSKFKKYPSRAAAIDDFCVLLKTRNPIYMERFKAWDKLHPKMADWKKWSLALQVHPRLSKSRDAYASQYVEAYKKKNGKIGYRHMKTHKEITGKEFYKKRKSSSDRSIDLTMKYDKLFKKYGY
jgi:hypothetical protein